jgi:D-xylono/L-arabinono-1,4-lactonase
VFCVERDGSVRLLWRGTGCANGMGFTPDGRSFYWTCSTTRQIYRAAYDRASGALSERSVIHVAGDGEGIPDGLAVDARGHLWSARWDGHAVYHLDDQACAVDRLTLPLAKVSSITFGGPNLDEAYVTTAGGTGAAGGGAEGTLFRVRGLGAVGQAEHYSKIRL